MVEGGSLCPGEVTLVSLSSQSSILWIMSILKSAWSWMLNVVFNGGRDHCIPLVNYHLKLGSFRTVGCWPDMIWLHYLVPQAYMLLSLTSRLITMHQKQQNGKRTKNLALHMASWNVKMMHTGLSDDLQKIWWISQDCSDWLWAKQTEHWCGSSTGNMTSRQQISKWRALHLTGERSQWMHGTWS